MSPRGFPVTMRMLVRGIRRDLEKKIISIFLKSLNKKLKAIQYDGTSQVENSLSLFKEMFRLNDLESEICLFLSIIQIWDDAQRLFEYHLGCNRLAGRTHLATVLGLPTPRLLRL